MPKSRIDQIGMELYQRGEVSFGQAVLIMAAVSRMADEIASGDREDLVASCGTQIVAAATELTMIVE